MNPEINIGLGDRLRTHIGGRTLEVEVVGYTEPHYILRENATGDEERLHESLMVRMLKDDYIEVVRA